MKKGKRLKTAYEILSKVEEFLDSEGCRKNGNMSCYDCPFKGFKAKYCFANELYIAKKAVERSITELEEDEK